MIVTIVVALVVGAAGFFGGYKYGQSKASANPPFAGQFGQNSGRTATRRFGNGNDFVNGEVINKDNTSLTIQLRAAPGATSTAAGSKIVILAPSTQITKAATGTPDDLTVGTSVVITGTDNSDGSMTAQTVQIRPQTAAMPGAANGR